MKEAKKVELIAKHAAARRRLRAEGREESLGNVLGIAGGSKRDIVALWTESDPDVAALPMTEAEEAFRRTFAEYLAAATRFNAITGIQVQYAYEPQRGRMPPPLTRRYALSPHHPWYKDLEEAVATAYQAHMQAWDALEGRQEAERQALEPARAPEPEPEPAPFDLVNLRAYYFDRARSPWPDGMTPPIESYGLLTMLWKEIDQEQAAAQRQRYVVMNAQGPESPAMAAVEDRQSAATVMLHHIKSDMNLVEQRAHFEGQPLPE